MGKFTLLQRGFSVVQGGKIRYNSNDLSRLVVGWDVHQDMGFSAHFLFARPEWRFSLKRAGFGDGTLGKQSGADPSGSGL